MKKLIFYEVLPILLMATMYLFLLHLTEDADSSGGIVLWIGIFGGLALLIISEFRNWARISLLSLIILGLMFFIGALEVGIVLLVLIFAIFKELLAIKNILEFFSCVVIGGCIVWAFCFCAAVFGFFTHEICKSVANRLKVEYTWVLISFLVGAGLLIGSYFLMPTHLGPSFYPPPSLF